MNWRIIGSKILSQYSRGLLQLIWSDISCSLLSVSVSATNQKEQNLVLQGYYFSVCSSVCSSFVRISGQFWGL